MMNSDTTSSSSIHSQMDVKNPQIDKLRGMLNLSTPGSPEETPPVFTFQRQRDVEINWKEVCEGVEMVFETKDAAEKFCVQFSEIDLRPSIIARRYNELKVMLGLAKSVSDALPPIDADKLKALIDAGTDVDEIARLQQKYARIMKNVADVEREIERLASIAENMGLILCTREQTINKPDKTQTKLEVGNIYRPYQHKVTWTTTHTRQQLRWAFFFYYKPVTFTRQHVEVITDYEPVNTSVDLLMRWREDHMKNNPQDEVIVFQQAGKRFVAADGSPLRAIMDRCDLDESSRRRCVVLLPIFEESLTGERVLTKYHVFKHPLPGITPAIMPRLTLEESLSYRTVWDGIVLGELATTLSTWPRVNSARYTFARPTSGRLQYPGQQYPFLTSTAPSRPILQPRWNALLDRSAKGRAISKRRPVPVGALLGLRHPPV